LSGAIAPFQPSTFAITVAERIPGSTYVRWDEVGHFGPLEKPELISQYVTSVVPTLS
jgi:pimeloyl-ACP methyl ester carboxylesterase